MKDVGDLQHGFQTQFYHNVWKWDGDDDLSIIIKDAYISHFLEYNQTDQT